jgi:hypothetical protein
LIEAALSVGVEVGVRVGIGGLELVMRSKSDVFTNDDDVEREERFVGVGVDSGDVDWDVSDGLLPLMLLLMLLLNSNQYKHIHTHKILLVNGMQQKN